MPRLAYNSYFTPGVLYSSLITHCQYLVYISLQYFFFFSVSILSAMGLKQSFYNFFPDIEITCSINDATIYYTVDGADPDTGSFEYISPVHLTETTTIKARAFKEGFSPSQIVSGTYIIEIQKADINKDRCVDISDVILCLRAAVSLDMIIDGQTYCSPYNDWIIAISDINNDAFIDILDVILILKKAVELE